MIPGVGASSATPCGHDRLGPIKLIFLGYFYYRCQSFAVCRKEAVTHACKRSRGHGCEPGKDCGCMQYVCRYFKKKESK